MLPAHRAKNNDQNLGTLSRLSILLESRGFNEAQAEELLRPLREIRQARQKPVHALRTNITDKTFVHRQVALLDDLGVALSGAVRWLSTYPKNLKWKPSLEPETYYRI